MIMGKPPKHQMFAGMTLRGRLEQMNSPLDGTKKTLGVAQEAEAEARSRRRQVVITGQWE